MKFRIISVDYLSKYDDDFRFKNMHHGKEPYYVVQYKKDPSFFGLIKPDWKSVYYNADFYREYLTSWDVTICASAGDAFRIAIQTRELGEALRDDENVTYLQYNMGHNDMKILIVEDAGRR